MDPGRRSSETTREAILASARAELRDRGSVSTKALAIRAGVSRQTIHHRCGGMRGILATLADESPSVSVAELATRERLVDAAIRVFSRPGAGRSSIESIAAEAGVTKGAFYHYFGDRADLIRAVAARVGRVDEILQAVTMTCGLDVREGLLLLVRTYSKAMADRAALMRNLVADVDHDPELGAAVIDEIIGRASRLIHAWLDEKIRTGELRPIEPSLILRELLAPALLPVALGPSAARCAVFGARSATDDIEECVDFVLSGARA
jgi:AcrR family transcriptional regulator